MNPELPKEGERFEGPSKTLTDAHFLFFSAVTGDVHPIHYDAEYAKGTRFGKPLAHGLMLAALTALGASSGRERLHGFVFVEQGCRFLRPAVLGDTVRPRQEVERIWEEKGKLFCRVKTTLLNQRDEMLIEGFHLYRVLRENELEKKP
jgi:acyl dehydratase